MAGEPQRRGSGPLQDVGPRLVQAGFQLLPAFQISTHYVLERDGFLALVERLPGGDFGTAGAPGMLLDGSFAVLVWKQEQPFFVTKGRQVPATPEQIETLRRFDADLSRALAAAFSPAPGWTPTP